MLGYFKYNFTDTTPCLKCPEVKNRPAAMCPGHYEPPYAKKGYWASTESGRSTFIKCFTAVCDGGWAAPNGTLSSCGFKASGMLCDKCEPGTWKYAKKCNDCPHPALGFLYVVMP